MEACTYLQQAGYPAVHPDFPDGRGRDVAYELEQGALAAAVGSDDSDDIALPDL